MSDETLAFPRPSAADIYRYGQPGAEGMYLRDYFAARAMVALLTSDGTEGRYFNTRAREAYEIADAMLAERCKPAKPPGGQSNG